MKPMTNAGGCLLLAERREPSGDLAERREPSGDLAERREPSGTHFGLLFWILLELVLR